MTDRASPSLPRSGEFVGVANAAPVMMWLSRDDGWRTFFNKKWLEFTGRKTADELGEGWAAGVHQDDRAACLDAYARAVGIGQPIQIEYRLRRADGEFRDVVDRAAPQVDGEGHAIGFVGCCIDITDRKMATAALRASETRFRLLAENASDMVYRYRVHPTFGADYVSPAVTAMTGRTPEEYAADPDLSIEAIHPDDRDKALAMHGDPARFRDPVVLRWVHRDGRIVWVEHHNTPVYDDEGALIAIEGIGRDITPRLAIETRLRESESQLRRLAASIEQAREHERTLIARELHDELGQSLTAIKLDMVRATRALMKQQIQAEAIDGLQSIVGEVEVATETVRRLATSLRPPALDHLGLVAAIELEAGALARRTGLRCRVVGNRRVTRLDPAHTTAVFRIVQAALTNAVRHATASAIRISINGTSRSTSVTVQDNGRGISDEQAADPAAIGIVGMRERAELIGACLTVTSKPGKGTTVSMLIRSARAEAADMRQT